MKKELDRYKEEYELAMKKDKDLEKSFRKEFGHFEQHFDSILKLYKLRARVYYLETQEKLSESSENGVLVKNDLSPFSKYEETLQNEEIPDDLVMESDSPADLNIDTWEKLMEYRNKKIQSERDVRLALKRFNRYQQLVASLMIQNDEIRATTEQTQAEIDKLQEVKFQSLYNVENLLSLKQGQVSISRLILRLRCLRHQWLHYTRMRY